VHSYLGPQWISLRPSPIGQRIRLAREALGYRKKQEAFAKLLGVRQLGSRAHFFDMIQYLDPEKPKRRPLEEMTFYYTRQKGLDGHESAQKLLESGGILD